MGKRGPTPKSAEVLRLTGNPGHRRKERLQGGGLTFPLELPPLPKFLDKVAKAEYRRLGKILLARGTIAAVDRGCLAMLCTAWADHVECEELLATLTPDEMVDPITGRQHPALKVSDRATKLVLRLSQSFGLTPSSRDSVAQSGPPPPPKRRRPAPGGAKQPATGWSQCGPQETQR